MKNVTHLRVTIEPWHLDNMMEIRIETRVNGLLHTYMKPFYRDDFNSCFDLLMEEASRNIKQLVVAQEQEEKE
jgi:hypothetical protein